MEEVSREHIWRQTTDEASLDAGGCANEQETSMHWEQLHITVVISNSPSESYGQVQTPGIPKLSAVIFSPSVHILGQHLKLGLDHFHILSNSLR
jgi:hypothetical protein